MNPDGISYIEIGRAGAQGQWHELINAYWSPLYPVMLSLVFRVVRPSLYWESMVVHALNFLVYLVAFYCFTSFLRELIALRLNLADAKNEQEPPITAGTFWILGGVLFLWSSQYWLTTVMVSGDFCVAACVFLAMALMLRIADGRAGWLSFAALGFVLGASYLAKSAMFVLAFVFFGCAFLLMRGWSRALPRAAVSLLCFGVIAAPWIAEISRAKHRVTFGDVGRIAYAEFVNHAPRSTHWQGRPPDSGAPAHPTRLVLADPPIYEFAQPIPGSYPPWRDPSYWYEGVIAHFALKDQLFALYRSANMYLKVFSYSGVLYVFFTVLLFCVWRDGRWSQITRSDGLLLMPSLAAIGLYALVLVDFRYVAGFALVLLMWVLSRVRMRGGAATSWQWGRCVMIAAPCVAIGWMVVRDAKIATAPRPFEQWQVAQALHGIGVAPGSSVAYIGTGLDAYWAHLAQVQIIAEIPQRDERAFLQADAPQKWLAMKTFAGLRAKAVLTRSDEVAASFPVWARISGTRYYVFRLNVSPEHTP
jgi:hypothetical protein